MRCAVTLRRDAGDVIASCADFPGCEGRAGSRDEALAKLRSSVLFWLEACPCDQTAGPGLVLTVVRDETGARG
jgi:predicted RNase H-like HicB family nuclease